MALRGLESAPEDSLDPADWEAFRDLAHRLLDDAIDHLRTVRERPVWQPVPDAVRQAFAQPLPVEGQGLERTCRELRDLILPYPTGNTHPRFWGWVHGSGTPGSMLAELIAAAMNANCGGRDHGAVYVERQVIEWCRELFGFPEGASGIVVSGTSLATLIGPELSRGFRALKVWFTLKEHGARRLGAAIERNCDQARYLAARIGDTAGLELMAPVALNIVCFRVCPPGLSCAQLDRLNGEIVADLQEAGVAAPSTTTLGGRTAIRVCLTNHRTRQSDLDALLEATIACAERRLSSSPRRGHRRRKDPDDGDADLAGRPDRFHQLRALSAPLDQLLIAGGGSRVEIDPASGLNAYGCAPHPRPDALAFGSSTASSISAQAYSAAGALREELVAAARARRLDVALDRAVGALRRGILEMCGATDLTGVEVVLAPSGTDGEYAALHLARAGPERPIVNIVMAPEETGSGVLAAAQGRHFAPLTSCGEAVTPDAPLAGWDPDLIHVPTVPIRGSDGRPRPLADVDAEVAVLVERAVATGRRCLLHVLAGSKTGLFAPSFDGVHRLRAKYSGQMDVVLDACQMRLSPERLRACLEVGWMVLLSGSKFFGGPAFAGALLVPAEIVARSCELAPLPAGLAGYFSRPEWPPALQHLAGALPEPMNLGLLLRWQAALTEMRAFQAVPARQRITIMTELGSATRSALEGSPRLRPVPVEMSGSDWPQTIFSFEVLYASRDGGERPLDLAAARQVHRWLNTDVSSWLPAEALCSARRLAALRCHLGQPVALGRTAALRVCIGAHLIWQVASDPSLGGSLEARFEAQLQNARLAVRKTELIAQYYDALCAGGAAVFQARSA